MKATVFFFLLLAVTLALASPQSGGPSADSDKPDGPRQPDNVPSKQAPFEGLPAPAPFEEASKQPAQPKRDEQHDEPQVAEDPEIDSQTLEPPSPPKDPRQKRQEADEGRHRFEEPEPHNVEEKRRPSSDDPAYKTPKPQQKRRPSSDDPAYKTPKPQEKRRPSSDDPAYKTPKAKRDESYDEGRHRSAEDAAKRQFHTDVKRDDADYGNRNRGGDHFEKRGKFSTNVKRRGGPPNGAPHHEQKENEDDTVKRDDADYANRNRGGDHFEKRDDADYGNRNRGGDHFEKRQKISTDVKRNEAAAPTPQYKKPHPNGRRADVPFYRPRSTVTEA